MVFQQADRFRLNKDRLNLRWLQALGFGDDLGCERTQTVVQRADACGDLVGRRNMLP